MCGSKSGKIYCGIDVAGSWRSLKARTEAESEASPLRPGQHGRSTHTPLLQHPLDKIKVKLSAVFQCVCSVPSSIDSFNSVVVFPH